jgi:glutathione S-transferase
VTHIDLNDIRSPTKSAPVIQDGNVTLGESGAIAEYILTKYGNGKLSIPPSAENYPDYLYYLHFGNGYFQPALGRYGVVVRSGLSSDNLAAKFAKRSFDQSLEIIEARVSKFTWLAGDEFTVADIMNVFSLTTMRLFFPYSLEGYNGIISYLQRVSERDGYKKAMAKGDPGFTPLLGAEKPEYIRS